MGATDVHAAVEAVDRLIREGNARGASDLHLDPTGSSLDVSWRVDGVLQAPEHLPGELAPRLAGRLKALADLLVWRTDVPQEGRIPADRSPIGQAVRVATFPALHGERIALRFETPEGGIHPLADLGLPEAALAGLRQALAEPEGVVLVTGPSGSGKTTTLYSALDHLVREPVRRSIVTIEDPVERHVAGVSQCHISRGAELGIASALRSMLRQDPDVLLVGEVRDRETASTVLEAGLTGHLVLSTIHAGTAAKVFARLLDLGLEPFAVTTAVRGVLAQRLVRRVTKDGSAGRVLVAEWLTMGPALRRAVHAGGEGDALARAAARDGCLTLTTHARDLVARGVTTEAEIERVLGHRLLGETA
jgi:type II secretory ATPase GspE/PulE/Tfp pilus assembly ATPase PilB-like protein